MTGALAVFLDFDGTLVEIAARPEAVVVGPEIAPLLVRLRERCGGALALVTGRSIAAIDGFLPDLGVDICGLHGMERRLDGRLSRIEVDDLPALRAVVPGLARALSGIPGVLIEDKGESLALHWRLNPGAAGQVVAAADTALRDIGPGFRIQDGKALVEIVPDASGKGRAISSLMARPPYLDRRAFFAGDDVTDENGFAAVNECGGWSLKVGDGSTLAQRRVGSPALLLSWLAELAAGEADWTRLELA